jgi:hypothetical protein
MAIENSGAISLGTVAGTNRSISAEFGGSTPHSLSEYYRDGSYSDSISIPAGETDIPASGAIKFSDFYGTAAFEATGNEAIGSWPSSGLSGHPSPWGSKNFTNANFAQVTATIDFLVDETNNRIEIRFFTSDSSAPSSFTTVYLTYVDLDISQSSVWECKADWNYTTSTGTGSDAATITEPASNLDNVYRTLNTSGRVSYTWQVTANSNNETGTIGGFGQGVTFYLRNTDGAGTVREANSGSKTIFLRATRGLQSGLGGPE